jgi:hypothetical protein
MELSNLSMYKTYSFHAPERLVVPLQFERDTAFMYLQLTSGRKRKSLNTVDGSKSSEEALFETSKKRRKNDEPVPEKRLARYKSSCPAKIRERMERVMTQR